MDKDARHERGEDQGAAVQAQLAPAEDTATERYPDRVVEARLLATALGDDAGVPVTVTYDMPLNIYVVRWRGGPTEDEMRALGRRCEGVLIALHIADLAWERG
jgi:hypothetical protein